MPPHFPVTVVVSKRESKTHGGALLDKFGRRRNIRQFSGVAVVQPSGM
jgi:hypothetical protein